MLAISDVMPSGVCVLKDLLLLQLHSKIEIPKCVFRIKIQYFKCNFVVASICSEFFYFCCKLVLGLEVVLHQDDFSKMVLSNIALPILSSAIV